MSSCTEAVSEQYVVSICSSGDSAEDSVDSEIGICSTPGSGSYVKTICVAGNSSTTGIDTNIVDCTEPGIGEYVTVACVAGDSLVTGTDTEITDSDEVGEDDNIDTTQCGDGIIQEGEVCDDGNINDGDGCDASCSFDDSGPESNNEADTKDSDDSSGFNIMILIPLTVVLLIAAIAIPKFSRYTKKTKTAEAGLNLKTLGSGPNLDTGDNNGLDRSLKPDVGISPTIEPKVPSPFHPPETMPAGQFIEGRVTNYGGDQKEVPAEGQLGLDKRPPPRAPDQRDGDSTGQVTTFVEYDALSRPTFAVEDDGQVSRTVYDGVSLPGETDPSLIIDPATTADIEEEIRAVPRVTGGRRDLSDPVRVRPATEYDNIDRVVRVSSYDSRDNPVLTSDAEGAGEDVDRSASNPPIREEMCEPNDDDCDGLGSPIIEEMCEPNDNDCDGLGSPIISTPEMGEPNDSLDSEREIVPVIHVSEEELEGRRARECYEKAEKLENDVIPKKDEVVENAQRTLEEVTDRLKMVNTEAEQANEVANSKQEKADAANKRRDAHDEEVSSLKEQEEKLKQQIGKAERSQDSARKHIEYFEKDGVKANERESLELNLDLYKENRSVVIQRKKELKQVQTQIEEFQQNSQEVHEHANRLQKEADEAANNAASANAVLEGVQEECDKAKSALHHANDEAKAEAAAAAKKEVPVEGQLGPDGSDPSNNVDWTWVAAAADDDWIDGDAQNDDEDDYAGTVQVADVGEYDFAVRFVVDDQAKNKLETPGPPLSTLHDVLKLKLLVHDSKSFPTPPKEEVDLSRLDQVIKENPLRYLFPQGPTIGDQLSTPWQGDKPDNTKWFEKNYSGWLKEVDRRINNVGDEIKNNISQGLLETELLPDLREEAERQRKREGSRVEDSDDVHYNRKNKVSKNKLIIGPYRDNETIFGDEAQSGWWADKVLGHFTFSADSVKIKYRGNYSKDGRLVSVSYTWSTTLRVLDRKGANKKDTVRWWLSWVGAEGLVKVRDNVEMAHWTVSGHGTYHLPE